VYIDKEQYGRMISVLYTLDELIWRIVLVDKRVSRVYFRIQKAEIPLSIQSINKHIYIHYT